MPTRKPTPKAPAVKKAAARVKAAAKQVARAVQKKAPAKKAPRAPAPALRERAHAVLARMQREIPHPHVELQFDGDPWRLLVATILSAQSTDKMVNKTMPELLARWPTPAALAAAPQEDVEVVVKSTGFFRNKAKAIRETSRALVERHGGSVPRSLEALVELPGVARKTANVVMGAAFGEACGVVIDTHAARVSQRLGFTKQTDPVRIEEALCATFDRAHWLALSHRLVLHGRYVCTARSPDCPRCPLSELCPSREAPPEGAWEARADAVAREMDSRAHGFSRVNV